MILYQNQAELISLTYLFSGLRFINEVFRYLFRTFLMLYLVKWCELSDQVQRAACIKWAGQFECDGSCGRGPVSKKGNLFFFSENYRLFEDKRARLSRESSFEEAKAPLSRLEFSIFIKLFRPKLG